VTIPGGIGIIMAELPLRRIVGHHGVHGSCGNGKAKPWPAEYCEALD
jgi:hypothetical protein